MQLAIDIETYSDVDLTKCGVYAYTDSPAFEILLFAYAFDDEDVQVVDVVQGESLPDRVYEALTDDSIVKTAFNAAFERTCIARHYNLTLPPVSWQCTAVQSAMLALPGSLDGVGEVLDIKQKKLKEGKDLVRYFSMPCKPTKANGGRRRNMPGDAPEKWDLFKSYCIRDVEAEREIRRKLIKFPIPDDEQLLYQMDQEINDRGVLVDQALVDHAVTCDNEYREQVTRRAYELSGLENPNSPAQIKDWLADRGVQVDSLSKKAVADLIKETDGEVLEMLKLRLLMAKTSVKKYEAIKRSVCSDGRVHGLLQFYGANRTGRWAGRLVQVQNLPQNHLEDLALARELVKAGDYETIDLLFDSVPGVLSELIRTAFIPKPGCRFIVADFSAIEARVLAWLAGEHWRLETFEEGGDIYCMSASNMFGVKVVKNGENGHLRQKGKIAELACIAEGSLVLTDSGLVPIEQITTDHKLWDGEGWVSHDGVIFKGEREVITYEGLTATEDHLVWVEGQCKPIPFGLAAASSAHLIQTGDGRRAIRLGENNQPGEKVEREVEPLLCSDQVPELRQDTVAESEQPAEGSFKGMPEMLTATADPDMVGSQTNSGKAAVRESERPRLPQLRRKRDQVRLSKRDGSRAISDRDIRSSREEHGDRPDRYERGLCSRESALCDASCELCKSAENRPEPIQAGTLAVCKGRCDQEAVCRTKQRRDHTGRGDSGIRTEKELETHRSTARVYDIRNAGRHHRFTVSGKLVHNCGYGGSVGALKAMGALDMGIPEEELPELVSQWRSANPHIVNFWWDIDKASMKAVKEKTTVACGNITFSYRSGMLFITLPSGRRLSYVKPRLETNRFDRPAITYEGVGESKKWMRIETYGAKLTENIVQATARDLLAQAMLRLRKAGFDIVMHIHDEAVLEVPDGVSSVEEVCRIMSETPEWAAGLPLNADGYECDFYKKE